MNKDLSPPHVQLAIMSRQYVVSRCIQALAHLGVADHMSLNYPVDIIQLAHITNTIPELLDRVLTFLCDYDLFNKSPEGYMLTELSLPLKKDAPHSIKEVLGMVDDPWWQAFTHLETQLINGLSGFKQQHGSEFHHFLNDNPEHKMHYEKGMIQLSAYDDQAVAKSFACDRFNTLCDIGYGRENLVQVLATLYPQTTSQTCLLNVEDAKKPLFTTLPQADAYFLKGILHDFNDGMVEKILHDLLPHMHKDSLLFIAEQVIAADDIPHTNKTMDIIMMVLVGGKQRTLRGWQTIAEQAGFKLMQTYPIPGVFTVMEFAVKQTN